MQWFGKPVPISRFLGQVDQDDPTNLPAGLAAVCRNTDFTRDSPGVTCANTRCGYCVQPGGMQGVNKAPITGLQAFTYEPELPTESFFQMPLAFDFAGLLQREYPVGSRNMIAIASGEPFTPPTKSHMLSTQAGNKVWAAFSDLLTPSPNGAACFDPNTLSLNRLGMKPFGWRWTANTPVFAGEICTPPTPANGNGHTYQAQNNGTTGAVTPAFPTGDGATFVDNGVTWKELTMVIANRLPAPASPVMGVGSGGTIATGRDVYVVLTLENNQGETLPSIPTFVTTRASAAAIAVAIPSLAALPSWVQGLGGLYVPTAAKVYVASVATGGPAPALSIYAFVSVAALGTNFAINSASGTYAPPSVCTARITPGQLPTPTVEPDVTRDASGGAFPAGRDVYVLQTYTNANGETKAGPPSSIINTNVNDAVQVAVAAPQDSTGKALYTIASIGLYEADVATGTSAPDSSEFSVVGFYQSGATATIGVSATGVNPPTANTTGPGGAIVADTSTGGPNGTQGYRYAACMFMNQNETVSGYTAASVVKCVIDEDGWEIGAFNVATGPRNVVGRAVAFSVADGTQAGPFNWIGMVNLIVPAQNQVYPQTYLSDGIPMTSTFFLDNATTQGFFNFTDEYLQDSNNVTDRLRVTSPPTPMRIDYLESLDRLALTGVPGYFSGTVISLGEDYESFYGDTSPVPIAPNGEICYGVTDKYKGIPFALRSKSGFALTPNGGDPASWDARKRWDQVGPCGFRAWDACGKFIAFANEEGIFKYDESDPDLVSKEVPRGWGRVNWLAKQTVCLTIDENTHTVRVQVPTGNSMVPCEEVCLSYLEGWNDPIHFSTYSGKEISMDAARRYSFNDVSAFVCLRMSRTLLNPPQFLEATTYAPRTDSSFYLSQLLYGSAAADGMINARTPGVFNDNGAGIDWQYETMSSGMMQATCKPEGFNLNADGSGTITASFIAGRDHVTGQLQNKVELKCRPIALDPSQKIGITRKVPPKINEFWRVRFTNGKQANVWASLKAMTVYLIPWSGGRGALDR